jgi:VWFA-related protein
MPTSLLQPGPTIPHPSPPQTRSGGLRRAAFALGASLLLKSPVLAQQPPQAPPASAQQAPTQQTIEAPIEPPRDPGDIAPAPTFRVTTRRVVVDVVVTDQSGKPVAGLSQSDFQLFEQGKPQRIRSFEAHAGEAPVPAPHLDLPPNTFSNLSSAPRGGPVTVILYDLLNTPLDAQAYAKAELLKFLKQRSQSGQVAIFALTDQLHMLQGFTDDDNALIAALNSPKGRNYKSSNLQSSAEASVGSNSLSQAAGDPSGATASQSLNQSGASTRQAGTDASYQAMLANLQHMETMESSYLVDRRVDITADALEEIARFLAGLPGRKNLLWLSGSFPSGILPDEDLGDRDTFEVTRHYSGTIMKATDLLNLSHVAVYPVDVRGLQVNPIFSAASSQTFAPNSRADVKALNNFTQQEQSEHATMDQIGDGTGGRAFYNTNGLTEAEQAAMRDGSTYYTLSYSPDEPKSDGSLRKVKVELSKPGYHLMYRRNYFADDLDARVQAAADSPNDPLKVSLQHGAPTAHELFFVAHLQTRGEPAPATPEEMALLVKYEAMYTKNARTQESELKKPIPMQHYIITYGLLARQLGFDLGADGIHRGTLEFAIMAYNDDGKAMDGMRTSVQDAIPPERYERIRKNGYEVIQIVNIPEAAASLRISVRSATDNRIGSLEIRLPLANTPQPPVSEVR